MLTFQRQMPLTNLSLRPFETISEHHAEQPSGKRKITDQHTRSMERQEYLRNPEGSFSDARTFP